MKRPGVIALSLEPGDKEKLEALALKLGYVWGQGSRAKNPRGNISWMINQIANGELIVKPKY